MKKRNIIIVFILCTLSLLVYASFIEPNLLTVHSVNIQTNDALKPCKIVLFTDTHFGRLYDDQKVEAIVGKINELNPDIVVFGGDLIDNYKRDEEIIDIIYLSTELAKIEATIGKYAVWGNHDYGGGAERVYEQIMVNGGFEMLKNESRSLNEYGIEVMGYDDYLMGWSDPSVYDIKSDKFNLLISHEPYVSKLIHTTTESLMLAGHTHGGQVAIPFLRQQVLPAGSGGFVKGLYSTSDIGSTSSVQLYISSGIGMTIFPVRFLNVPEIVEINIEVSK